jgi:anaerobic selenocysteine-containing dehydrogenase
MQIFMEVKVVSAKRIQSTCLGCLGNCGVVYEVENNKIISVKGDPQHPLTRGYICPKGRAVEEARTSPDRLRHPLKRMGGKGEGKWTQISWDEATDEIAAKLGEIKEKHGPEAIALADGVIGVCAGLDPDAGRFLHFLGSPNRLVDTHN